MQPIKLQFAPEFDDIVSPGKQSLFVPRRRVMSGADFFGRALDILLAILFSLLSLPVLLIAALVVKLENPRASVFFRQVRFGYYGQPFTIIKLRTMVPEAEQLKSKLIALSPDKGPGFKIVDDPRITPVGYWLRRFYVDEIPQFVSVLKGDMSIVGPRANSYNPESYEPWQRIRLIVKPGLTGSWQVAENKPVSFDDRCRMDMDYVTRKSVFLDFAIIFNTIVMLLTRVTGH